MDSVAPLTSPGRLVDVVHERLREEILNGEIEPGQKLSVPTLAQKLQVSRSPIAAAIQRLVQDGLAVEEPRKGAVVTLISIAELLRLYEIREVLEGLSSSLSAERASAEKIEEMSQVIERHEAAVVTGDQQSRQLENVNFHRLIRDTAENPELGRWLEEIQLQVKLAMRRTGTYMDDVELTVREHRAILDAIKRRDPVAAEQAARVHIRRVREKLALVDPKGRAGAKAVA